MDELQEGRLLRTKAGSRAALLRSSRRQASCPCRSVPAPKGNRSSGGLVRDGWVVCPGTASFRPGHRQGGNGVCANAEVFPGTPWRMAGTWVFPYTTLRFLGIDWW